MQWTKYTSSICFNSTVSFSKWDEKQQQHNFKKDILHNHYYAYPANLVISRPARTILPKAWDILSNILPLW